MSPARRREICRELRESYRVSERRACRATGFHRGSLRYTSRKPEQVALRQRLRELALARPRWGYRRLWILLRREGWAINHKRVYRLYIDEGLQVRIRPRNKLIPRPRCVAPVASRVNERWSMDFMSARLACGRPFRLLNAIDVFSREALTTAVARGFPSTAVTQQLDRVIAERGKPSVIQVDNGPEFTSRHFDAWAYMRGIEIDYIQPGKPVENAHIESFNGRVRDECLNTRWFATLTEAAAGLEVWRRDYNEVRPHSQLGDDPPAAFAARLAALGRPDGHAEALSSA